MPTGLRRPDAKMLWLPVRRVDRPDRGAALLLVHAMLGDVRIGADPDIEPAVGAGGEALGPVMVALSGERRDRARRGADAGRARIVREGDEAIGIGDVERAADQRHAEGRGQAGDVGRPHLRHAVAVGVAQQRDPIGARHRRARLALEEAHERTLDAVDPHSRGAGGGAELSATSTSPLGRVSSQRG